MGIHTADAIVLRQYPYRETSALVTCLTDRFGKIKGIIKGLRAPQSSRYRSAMEPLTLNRIVFYDTRTSTLHLISQCDLISAFPALVHDLDLIHLATFCAELIDALVELDEPHAPIFELLKGTFERLSTGAVEPMATRIHFVLRLLRLVGFQPQLDECTGCGQYPQDHRAFWSARQGGLLCAQCLHEDPKAEEIPSSLLEALTSCAELEEPRELDVHQATAIQQRLDEFLRWRLERPLKTMKTLRSYYSLFQHPRR